MITILANALVPIFAGLLLGYIAGLRNVVDNRNVKSLITFVMSFALPRRTRANANIRAAQTQSFWSGR